MPSDCHLDNSECVKLLYKHPFLNRILSDEKYVNQMYGVSLRATFV
jgi:hypothetical protein